MERVGCGYHITARGNGRRDLFRDETDRRQFLKWLEEAVPRLLTEFQFRHPIIPLEIVSSALSTLLRFHPRRARASGETRADFSAVANAGELHEVIMVASVPGISLDFEDALPTSRIDSVMAADDLHVFPYQSVALQPAFRDDATDRAPVCTTFTSAVKECPGPVKW